VFSTHRRGASPRPGASPSWKIAPRLAPAVFLAARRLLAFLDILWPARSFPFLSQGDGDSATDLLWQKKKAAAGQA